ncbi:MAG: hypothetical protein CM15mV7_0860 [uncultured marine virus]|nr:MAG: hypothetical protein CM15mV7_0860 [uncultured marine virus]
MFIGLLEGLHADEAQVVISAINKNLHKSFDYQSGCGRSISINQMG